MKTILSASELSEYISTIVARDSSVFNSPIQEAHHWLFGEILSLNIVEKNALKDEQYCQLFALCKYCIAYKAYLIAIPRLDLVQDDNGFAVVNNDKLVPASRERVNALVNQITASLSDSLYRLVCFMNDTESLCDDYATTKIFTQLHSTYLSSPYDFDTYEFSCDFITYIDSIASRRRLMVIDVEGVISRELSSEILKQLHDGKISAPNLEILPILKDALVQLYNADMRSADIALQRTVRYIKHHIKDFPTYESSELYIPNEDKPINQHCKSIGAII